MITIFKLTDLSESQADAYVAEMKALYGDKYKVAKTKQDSKWTVCAVLTESAEWPANVMASLAVIGGENPAAAPPDPPWLAIARQEYGDKVKEVPGAGDHPRIVEYFTATSLGAQPDSVPWCGAFVAFCLREAGRITGGSARAADWLGWGEGLESPRPGCITVLQPQSPGASGHVAFWVGEKDGKALLLGGNQSDAVNITGYPETEVRGYRWPAN